MSSKSVCPSVWMTLDQFRAQFRVVNPHEAAAQEPNKHYDPFVERE